MIWRHSISLTYTLLAEYGTPDHDELECLVLVSEILTRKRDTWVNTILGRSCNASYWDEESDYLVVHDRSDTVVFGSHGEVRRNCNFQAQWAVAL